MNEDLRRRAAAFAADVVQPNAASWELTRTVPLAAYRQAAASGLTGMALPASLGGTNVGFLDSLRVLEELAYACLPFAFGLVVHNNLMRAIARFGSPAQIARFLPRLATYERVGAFLLTEPGGGSDAANLATTARREAGVWVIDGAKAWISNAAVADVLSVYAQTEPGAGARGIACFLVEASQPGVVREAPYDVMGGYALGTGGFQLTGVRVADDAVLLPPGAGFKGAMAGIDNARATVAAMCCGLMRCGLDTALEYASKRRAFGQMVADFQGVQWMLADVATDLEAARLLSEQAARLIEAGENATLAAAHAKKFATRAALKGLGDCMQVMGAAGFRHDRPLARHLASAKMAQYLDGATEIQNVVIARALLRPYRAGRA